MVFCWKVEFGCDNVVDSYKYYLNYKWVWDGDDVVFGLVVCY